MSRRFILLLIVSLSICGTASAQPKIAFAGIRNSASYAPPGFLNSGIAQGSLFVIFGEGLGPANLQSATAPLPTEFAGTAVRITSSNQTLNAYLLYVSSSQIGAMLPSGTPLGPATIT